MVKFSALLAASLALSSLCSAQPASQHQTPAEPAHPSAPSDIFFNGTIYTGVGFSEDQPQIVAAMAIRGGRVLAVGTSNEITRLAGPNTHLHDLGSASSFIFPGFNDAHTHLGGAGQNQAQSRPGGGKGDLWPKCWRKSGDFRNEIAPGALDHPAGAGTIHSGKEKKFLLSDPPWISTEGHRRPSRISPDRVDGHITSPSRDSAALAAAGVTRRKTGTAARRGHRSRRPRRTQPASCANRPWTWCIRLFTPPITPEERRSGGWNWPSKMRCRAARRHQRAGLQ